MFININPTAMSVLIYPKPCYEESLLISYINSIVIVQKLHPVFVATLLSPATYIIIILSNLPFVRYSIVLNLALLSHYGAGAALDYLLLLSSCVAFFLDFEIE